MPPLTNDLVSVTPSSVNQRLLGTALAGLLCLAAAGCTVEHEKTPKTGSSTTPGAAGATDMPGSSGSGGSASSGGTTSMTGGTGTVASGGTATSAGAAGAGGAEAAGGTPAGSGGVGDVAGAGGFAEVAGAGGAADQPPHITSSKDVGVLSADDFKALCDARGGVVEIMPHCGGFATARGFSYDAGTQLLSEHTCMGANTCGGWNCVILE